jgi:hypothetical protein
MITSNGIDRAIDPAWSAELASVTSTPRCSSTWRIMSRASSCSATMRKWGAGGRGEGEKAPKIREKLRQRSELAHLPAISTVHAVLDRHGLVKRRRRRRHLALGTELSRPIEPNALWCADYKGESCSATAATATR